MRIHIFMINNNKDDANCTFAHYRHIADTCLSYDYVRLGCTFMYISGAWWREER